MITLNDMAKAHLDSVKNAIVDLENRKVAIDEEIKKLTDYVQQGTEVVKSSNK